MSAAGWKKQSARPRRSRPSSRTRSNSSKWPKPEGDNGAGRRWRRRAGRACRAGRAGQGRGAAGRRGGRQQQLCRDQCRRRRDRKQRLGRHAAAMYSRWAERHGMKVELVDYPCRRAGRDQVGDASDQRRECLWQSEGRGRRPPPGADQPVRQLGATPHQLRLGLGLSGSRRRHRYRGQRVRPSHRHLSRVRRGRAAHQHDRQRGPDHAHPDRHRGRLPERAFAAQEPRRGL